MSSKISRNLAHDPLYYSLEMFLKKIKSVRVRVRIFADI